MIPHRFRRPSARLAAALLLAPLLSACPTPGDVTTPPQIVLSTGALEFLGEEGAAVGSRSATIQNTGEQTLHWSALPGAAWVAVSPSSGSLGQGESASLTIAVNTGTLAAGTHDGGITFSGADAGDRRLGVSLRLTPKPSLAVAQGALSFTTQQGATPASQSASIGNTGGGTLTWSAAGSQPWITLSPAGGTLGGEQSGAVNVGINPAGLAAGSFAGRVTVTAPGAKNGTQGFDVALTVTQPPRLSVHPAALAFAAAQGASPAGQALTLTNTGGGTLTWTAAEAMGWLVGSPASGTLAAGQSATINLTVTTAGLAVGRHTGTITVSAAGAAAAPANIGVTLDVSAPPPPALRVSASALSFSAQQGSSPAAQAATVTNGGGGTLAWTASEALTWLVGTPGSGSLGAGQSATLTFTASTAGLAAGTYTGSVTVAAPGAADAPRTIAVTLNVTASGAPPALGVSASTLSFTTPQGSNPAGQALTLTNTGGGSLSWTAAEPIPWLVGSPASGTLSSGQSAALNLTVNTAGLAVGTHGGTLTITAPGASGSPRSVAVTLVVTAPPALGVSPPSLTFQAEQGANPPAQTLTVTNTGGGTLSWTAAEPMTWLVGSPASGTLTAGQSAAINLTVNTAGLAPGTYHGTLTVTAPGAAQSPRSVAVALTVGAPPPGVLEVSLTALDFQMEQGTNPAPRQLTIRNTGEGTLQWTAAEAIPWLVGSPSSGTLAAGQSATLNVSLNAQSLAAGDYQGAITVTAPGAEGSPQTVDVTLAVAAPPAPVLEVSPADLSFDAEQGTNPSPQQLTVRNAGEGTLQWTASEAIPWLGGSPMSGSLGAGQTATITVSLTAQSLGAGSHQGTLTVAAPGAEGSPRTVDVALTVRARPQPTLRIDGGLSSTRPIGATFVTTGSGYTPNGPVARYLVDPNGNRITLTPTMTADGAGNIEWAFTPVCTTPQGTGTLWAVDENTGAESNRVTQTITAGSGCGGGGLPAPALNAPGNGATGVSTTPTFSWSAVSGANRYWLMVATDPGAFPTDPNATSCPGCVVSGNTASTSHTLPNPFPSPGRAPALQSNTRYYWKVQGWNTDGRQGAYSAASEFTTAGAGGFRLQVFPLPNRTHATATINSVFDHSMGSPYFGDDRVVAYTSEEGRGSYGRSYVTTISGRALYALRSASGAGFTVNGHYSGGSYLAYDGHPGFDYRTTDQCPDTRVTADCPLGLRGRLRVRAAAAGRVTSVGGGSGTIVIDHGGGYTTWYLHLGRYDVTVGTSVSAGQTIGVSGDMGAAGAPHLHFEVRLNNVPVDPYGWLGTGADPYTRATNRGLW